MPLEFRELHVPLVAGCDYKATDYSFELPRLAICKECDFSELGTLQKRFGHDIMSHALSGIGGTLSSIRGLATRDDELVAFAESDTAPGFPRVFSYSPSQGAWVDKGHYEGVKVTERQLPQGPSNQQFGDRAQYGTAIVYAWEDSLTSSVHFQVFDAETGAVLCAEQDIGANSRRPRCIVVNSKLAVIYHDTAAARLKARVMTPSNIAGTVGNSAITVSNATHATLTYDVVTRDSTNCLIAYRNAAAQYDLSSFDGSTPSIVSKARTCDNPIAVAVAPDGRVMIVRDGGADLVADILSNSLTDTTTGKVLEAGVGTVHQLTLAFRTDIVSSQYKAVIFWSKDPTVAGNTARVVRAIGLDTNNTTFAVAGPSGSTNWIVHGNIASRAVGRAKSVYFVCARDVALAAAPQHAAYFLMREDGLILSRMLWPAPGRFTGASNTESESKHLNQLEDLGSDKYGFVGTYFVQPGLNQYADVGMKDFVFDYAAKEPYRGYQVGRTLYMTGGYLAAYDGQGVYEANFFIAPEKVTASAGSGGSMKDNKTYTYAAYWAQRNAQGELARSTRVASFTAATGAGGGGADDSSMALEFSILAHTMRRSPRQNCVLEIYRSVADQASPRYLVTSIDPTSGNYKLNDPAVSRVSFTDTMSDTSLVSQPEDYANSGELDNLAGSACTIAAQGQGRLFVAGGSIPPDEVWYSKLWQADTEVGLNDANTIVVPKAGGKITGIFVFDEAVVIFRERAIYVASGVGSPNVPDASGYGEPHLISADLGCRDHRSIINTPLGVMFQSQRGIRLLSPGLQIQDIGAPVDVYATAKNVSGAVTHPSKPQVIFALETQASPVRNEPGDNIGALVFDHLANAWSVWGFPFGPGLVVWNGLHIFTSGTYVWQESVQFKSLDGGSFFTTTGYFMTVETPHIQLAGLQGFGRVKRITVLGKYVASHKLRVELYYDGSSTASDTFDWTPDTTQYQLMITPSHQKARSVKIRLTDRSSTNVADPAPDDSCKLISLSLLIGYKPGLTRQPSTRRV